MTWEFYFFGSYDISHWRYTLKWKKYFCTYAEERNAEARFELSINKYFAWSTWTPSQTSQTKCLFHIFILRTQIWKTPFSESENALVKGKVLSVSWEHSHSVENWVVQCSVLWLAAVERNWLKLEGKEFKMGDWAEETRKCMQSAVRSHFCVLWNVYLSRKGCIQLHPGVKFFIK